MENGSEHGAFDKLVAGLKLDERKALLEKVKGISSTTNVPEFQIKAESRDETENILQKLKKESVLYYFILWVRSLFTQRRIEVIYNDDLINSIVRNINNHSCVVVDYRHKIVCSDFYDYLLELKECADFFRPYVSLVADYPGEFYVFLSAYIAPEISVEIKKEVDPYTIPFERDIISDTKISKIRNLESVLRSIGHETRARLYDAVKRVEWLNQFSLIPYIHFIAQFTNVNSDKYTCPFENAQLDYPAFSRVLSAASSVPAETLQALYLFQCKKNSMSISSDIFTEKKLRDFVETAAQKFSKIHSFVSSVPLDKLGCVLFHSYDWQCEKFGGAEDWFQKFHDEWRHIFDEQWESWLRDRKKYQLANLLKIKFGIDAFPDLPYRPWAELWDGVQFSGELTGGFLVWFGKNRLPMAIELLSVLTVDGVFVSNENRAELSDTIDSFKTIIVRIDQFVKSISEQGSYGAVFDKLQRENSRTMRAQSQVDSILLAAEAQIHELNKKFCDGCRSVERVLGGIFDEKKKNGYSGLQNFASIRGKDNSAYRDKLSDVRAKLADAQSLLAEVEPLDLPKNRSRR